MPGGGAGQTGTNPDRSMKTKHDVSYISRLSAPPSPAQSLPRVHTYNMATLCGAEHFGKVTRLLPANPMQALRYYSLLL